MARGTGKKTDIQLATEDAIIIMNRTAETYDANRTPDNFAAYLDAKNGYNHALDDERRERFETHAALRVRNVIKSIRILGECSKTSLYKYSGPDVQKAFARIDAEIADAQRRFSEQLAGDVKAADKKTIEFSF